MSAETTLRTAAPSDAAPSAPARPSLRALLPYLLTGVVFGVILVKGEIVSWYRIQEMFRFDAFHMYGVMGSGIVTAFVSLRLLRRSGLRAANGQEIALPPKFLGRGTRYWAGGAIFGVGWAFSGACPGPMFALIGAGPAGYLVTALAAVAGAWTYGSLRHRLPY